MKVKDLIKILNTANPENEVYVDWDECDEEKKQLHSVMEIGDVVVLSDYHIPFIENHNKSLTPSHTK